jgi:hypothetical protein
MDKSNTQAATIEIPVRGIRTRLFWKSGRLYEILKLKLNYIVNKIDQDK